MASTFRCTPRTERYNSNADREPHARRDPRCRAGLTSWVGHHPDGRRVASHEWPLARALAGARVEPEEYRVECLDGSVCRTRVNAAPILDAEGQLAAAEVVFADIQEERRLEAARRDSEALAREVIETSPDAFVRIDGRGAVLEWRAAAEALLGWQQEEAIGWPLAWLVLPAREREAFRASLGM